MSAEDQREDAAVALPENWSDMRIDSRLLEAIKDLRWSTPLPVQKACIPHALRGNDISLQSRTGSGKTGAFAIPMIQRLLTETARLSSKRGAAAVAKPVGLILVPSVELCEQTVESTTALCKYVKPRVVIENLANGKGSINDARILSADIVVSTAAAIAKQVKSGAVTERAFRQLRTLVIDEVDMVVAITERSLRQVQSVLPQSLQTILCSATLTEGVAMIKGQLLHSPVHITLTADEDDGKSGKSKRTRERDGDGDAGDANDAVVESHLRLKDASAPTLKQYSLVATSECHKHTLLFSLFRLKLIDGKTLIFADDDEDTYKLEHFLQQLGVACMVYDVSLPTNARLDILRRFQRGEVATLICTDNTLESAERLQMSMEDADQPSGAAESGDALEDGTAPAHKRRRTDSSAAPNSALHRGVDFNKVRNVIIFDGMDTASAINVAKYTHRVGRTGRGGLPGTSIVIFSVPQAQKALPALRDHLRERGTALRPFKQLDRSQAARLQYRVDTVLANVTRNATRKLRVATVASELARSSYLSTHLSQKDSEALSRIVSKSTKAVRCDPTILDVPKYMSMKGVDGAKEFTTRVNTQERKETVFRQVTKKKNADPLKAVVSKVRQAKRESGGSASRN